MRGVQHLTLQRRWALESLVPLYFCSVITVLLAVMAVFVKIEKQLDQLISLQKAKGSASGAGLDREPKSSATVELRKPSSRPGR